MVPDVSTGDPTMMLCLHCARRVVSPKSLSKYDRLASYLRFRASFTDTVKLPFARIDGVIGDNLPMSAYKTEVWWDNVPSNVHAKAWLGAGWETREVNLKEGYVVFHTVKDLRTKEFRKKRVRRDEIEKPFTPVRVRVPKPKTLSKTRVSRFYGRVKNVERRRALMPTYHGSFKPKPVYEKKLYKPEKKPQ
jgi:hypothetical protein